MGQFSLHQVQDFQLANGSICFRLLPHIKGNVGFVFTKEDLVEVRDLLLSNKVRHANFLQLSLSK